MRFTHQPGAKPLEGYTIHRGIHRGGFGEVYYALSDGGKEVALKLLQRDQDVELRGVRQCLNLKHPNLVSLFDVRTDSHGEQWVVMEYVNGSSLEDVLASFPNGLPLDEVQDWLSGIVAGVSYLHDRGIVHRDLKPGNVYRENGTVKVGDVGLSKRLGTDRRAAQTQSVGTVYYMAPEVAKGQYGPEVDVYGLGIMLYEMLTGHLPFMGETTAEVLMKHLTSTPDMQGIPDGLRSVVARSLAKDPRQRTQSALHLDQEFRDAIHASKRVANIPVTAGRVSGFAATSVRTQMAETPSVANGAGATTDTAAIPPIGPARTKTAAQAASAYAHYPPETKSPAPPEKPVPARPAVSSAPKKTPTPVAPMPSPSATAPLNWPLIVTAIVGLMLYSPGSLRSWSGLGLIGMAYGAAAMMRGRNCYRIDLSRTCGDPSLNAHLSRELLGWRPALCDTAASLSVGSVCAALLSVGTIFAAEFLQRSPQAPSAEFLTLFTATSLGATWLILLADRLRQHFKWVGKNPRKTFLAVGIITGLLAFALDQYLLVDYFKPAHYSPAFRTLGVHRLLDGEMNPTLLGYSIFFGGILFWHRWWQDMSPRRSRQLSFGRLCTVGIAAWLLTVVFAFPQWPAILWGITISASIQMATPWNAPVRRHSKGGN